MKGDLVFTRSTAITGEIVASGAMNMERDHSENLQTARNACNLSNSSNGIHQNGGRNRTDRQHSLSFPLRGTMLTLLSFRLAFLAASPACAVA